MTRPLAAWAPQAQRVAVEVAGRQRSLERRLRGWWELPDPALAPGTDYSFCIDGGPPRPDPRSAHQPDGVHGPSRVVDHSCFAWTDAGFRAPPLPTAVVYELHIGTFSPAGTFDGAIARLDHLVDLGVTHVELMPVNQFPGRRGWGYDGVGLYAVHDAYGGPDGLKRLVNACHARGLAVLLDVVYNHLGPDGNYLAQFAPYFTDAYRTFWGPALNLDQAASDEVRRFVIDNALHWLRHYHFDGLRIDAIHAFFDRSAKHLLEELGEAVEELEREAGRPLVLIAESDLNDPRVVRSREAGGFGMHAQWSDDLHHAIHALLTGETDGYYADFGRIEHLARAITEAYVYQGEHAPHRQRRHGRAPMGIPRSRFLGYLQTHDQVGNRARGDRIGHLTSADRVRVGALLVLASPSVPLLFQGEEWNASTPFCYFTDHTRPGLVEQVREGRRAEFAAFGWKPDQIPDPNHPETFDRSVLRWEEIGENGHASMLAWYRELVALRRQVPELGASVRRVRWDDAGWLLIERDCTMVVVNLGQRTQIMDVGSDRRLLCRSRHDVALQSDSIVVPPDTGAIVIGECRI